MGTRSRLLVNQAAFTADTTSLPIPADNIENLQFGVASLDATAGTKTKAEIIALLDEVIVTLGGHNICKLLFDDLVALDQLYWNHYPQLIVGGATGLLLSLGGIMLPIHVTKNGRSLACEVSFGTAVNATYDNLNVEYQYQDTPYPLHFAYQYQQQLGAANLQWTGMQRVGSALQALLIYNELEDCATPATLLPEIAELFAFVDDREVYHTNFFTMKTHHSAFASERDITDGYGPDFGAAGFNAELGGHYKLIIFPEPWRADNLRFVTNNTCGGFPGGSNGTCRLIGVFNEP